MTKYFVFDTNSLISANLIPNSIHRRAIERASELGQIVRSVESFKEFASTFSRPKFDKYLPAEDRAQAIARYKDGSLLVEVKQLVKAARDPDDDMILSLAVSVNADCIISKDKDLLELHPFRGIPILTATAFLELF